MPSRGPNAKAQAALEKKSAAKAEKDAQKARQKEAEAAADWKKGSNVRAANRKETEAAKADEAARQRKLKADLLAAEENDAPTTKIKKSQGGAKKGKKKKKDDLSLLEDALISDADKKSKAAKRAARLKKEEEEERKKREKAKVEEMAGEDPLLANTTALIGDIDGDNIGRKANRASMMEGNASGIDGALNALSVDDGNDEDIHPEKRMKALHKAFEERMMPEMKEQYPGLKMSQYKEKIFALWKKSPENPMNRVKK